jgi:hypothetical protein
MPNPDSLAKPTDDPLEAKALALARDLHPGAVEEWHRLEARQILAALRDVQSETRAESWEIVLKEAVEKEREACAQIADWEENCNGHGKIAAAIRGGSR